MAKFTKTKYGLWVKGKKGNKLYKYDCTATKWALKRESNKMKGKGYLVRTVKDKEGLHLYIQRKGN